MLNYMVFERFNREILSGDRLTAYYVDEPGVHRPFRIKSIGGIGPVDATISTSDLASMDGSKFLSARTGERNIVLKIEYNPDYGNTETAGDLRRRLYSILPPKSHVAVYLVSDDQETLSIDGWVESHEPSIFAKESEVDISIICPDGYLKGASTTSEWPEPQQGRLIDFTEDVPVGFLLTATVTSNLATLSLMKTDAESPMVIKQLVANDRVALSTVRGDKYLRVRRGGVTLEALNLLDDPFVWYDLNRDDTNFFWFSTGAAALSDVSITYRRLIMGV